MSQHHDDFATEPLPGLPAKPPRGEEILWQGRPAILPLARDALGLNAPPDGLYFIGATYPELSVGFTTD